MSLIVKIKKQLDNFMLSVDMELTDEVVSVLVCRAQERV